MELIIAFLILTAIGLVAAAVTCALALRALVATVRVGLDHLHLVAGDPGNRIHDRIRDTVVQLGRIDDTLRQRMAVPLTEEKSQAEPSRPARRSRRRNPSPTA